MGFILRLFTQSLRNFIPPSDMTFILPMYPVYLDSNDI